MPEKPLLLADPYPQVWERIFNKDTVDRIEDFVVIKRLELKTMPEAEFDELLSGAFAFIGQTAMTRHRLERAGKLKVIFNVEGNFYPNIDYEYCFREGIYILNCGPVYALPVAEMGIAMAIDVARGITREDRRFRRGQERYLFEANQDSLLLSASTVGLVGFGTLGRTLRLLLEPFHCRIKAYDPWLPASELIAHGCEPVSLDVLLESCTFIFVVAGVTTENRGFLDARELDLIRPGSIVILLSRAAIIDFEEFVKRVQSGAIKAASDVFPTEPLPKNHPARSCENFILSPHRGGAIPQALFTIGEMVADDLELIIRGLPPVRMQRAQRETVMRFCSKPAG